MREIIIRPALNGFMLNVGCQQIVFEDRKKMLAELAKYLANPLATERRYLKDAVNKMPDVPPPAIAMPCNVVGETPIRAERR